MKELLNKKSLRDYVNIEDASTAVKIINDQIMNSIDELKGLLIMKELLNKKSLRDYVNIEDTSTAVKITNDQIMKLIDELNEINIIEEKIKEQIKDLNRVALYLNHDYETDK